MRRRGKGNIGVAIPVIALACLLGGCAARKAPPPKTVAAPAASPPARLAWLPVDRLASAEIAGVVNETLTRLAGAGATEAVRAPVSMEVAQLTIECIQPTAACYSAVGRSFKVDRLLWVEMGSKEAGATNLRVTLALFDVNQASFVHRKEWSFASVAEAQRALPSFIERALVHGETRSGAAPAVAVRTPAP